MTDRINLEEINWPDNIQHRGVHPQKFALYVGIAVMSMSIAGLTSAYIVRKGAGNWVEFAMPDAFVISAALILLSSLTLHLAVKAFRKENITAYRALLGLTVLLALSFAGSQWMGWQKLQEMGIYIAGNPSGSFVYVISFVHMAHLAVGLLFLIGTLVRAFVSFGNPAKVLIYNTHPDKRLRLELLAIYWHFVDLLWLYLLVFFLIS
ncbi:MAG: cytochrome c oxidase subunit 3 [Chitinophagales bacterium]